VIEFTVKPSAGVREGTVGPMFDTIKQVELPGQFLLAIEGCTYENIKEDNQQTDS
jgi:hypothetical protein